MDAGGEPHLRLVPRLRRGNAIVGRSSGRFLLRRDKGCMTLERQGLVPTLERGSQRGVPPSECRHPGGELACRQDAGAPGFANLRAAEQSGSD